MVASKQQSRLALAGLDERDMASDNHSYLQLAQAQARRARTARLTPGGLPQPPEVMGVDADARVPNRLQPMDGEFEDGREVGAGRPAFFGRDMPPPTGLANGVGVGSSLVRPASVSPGSSFGAPTGMPLLPVGNDRFAGPDLSGLTSYSFGGAGTLPHFAAGGALPPGGAGIVDGLGEEAIATIPSGRVLVTPLHPTAAGLDAAATALIPVADGSGLPLSTPAVDLSGIRTSNIQARQAAQTGLLPRSAARMDPVTGKIRNATGSSGQLVRW